MRNMVFALSTVTASGTGTFTLPYLWRAADHEVRAHQAMTEAEEIAGNCNNPPETPACSTNDKIRMYGYAADAALHELNARQELEDALPTGGTALGTAAGAAALALLERRRREKENKKLQSF